MTSDPKNDNIVKIQKINIYANSSTEGGLQNFQFTNSQRVYILKNCIIEDDCTHQTTNCKDLVCIFYEKVQESVLSKIVLDKIDSSEGVVFGTFTKAVNRRERHECTSNTCFLKLKGQFYDVKNMFMRAALIKTSCVRPTVKY